MEIGIASDFAAAGTMVRLGCILTSVTVGASDSELRTLLDNEAVAQAHRLKNAKIAEIPSIGGTRRAYKAFGKDPARYRPSAEALLRRVKQGKGLYRVNSVVDVNNLVSLRTGISIGAYTVEQLSPPLVFRRAGEGESYEAIGRGPMNLEGLPVMTDKFGPFGSPTSDSTRSLISEATETLLMVLFGFGEVVELDKAMELARGLLEAHCGAQGADVWFVDNGVS